MSYMPFPYQVTDYAWDVKRIYFSYSASNGKEDDCHYFYEDEFMREHGLVDLINQMRKKA